MCPAIVQQEAVQAVGEGVGERINEDVQQVCIQIWPFREEPVARDRLHGAIDGEPVEDMLDRSDGLPRAASWTAYSWPMPAVAPVINEVLMGPPFQDGRSAREAVRHNCRQ